MLPRLYIKGPNVLFFIYHSFSFWTEKIGNNAVTMMILSVMLKAMILMMMIFVTMVMMMMMVYIWKIKRFYILLSVLCWGMSSFVCLHVCFCPMLYDKAAITLTTGMYKSTNTNFQQNIVVMNLWTYKHTWDTIYKYGSFWSTLTLLEYLHFVQLYSSTPLHFKAKFIYLLPGIAANTVILK